MEENEAVNENLMELAQRIDTAVLQKDEYALLLLISGCEARLEAEKGESRTDLYYFMANALAGIFGCKDSENYRWSWEQTEGVSELLALRKRYLSNKLSADFMRRL